MCVSVWSCWPDELLAGLLPTLDGVGGYSRLTSAAKSSGLTDGCLFAAPPPPSLPAAPHFIFPLSELTLWQKSFPRAKCEPQRDAVKVFFIIFKSSFLPSSPLQPPSLRCNYVLAATQTSVAATPCPPPRESLSPHRWPWWGDGSWERKAAQTRLPHRWL